MKKDKKLEALKDKVKKIEVEKAEEKKKLEEKVKKSKKKEKTLFNKLFHKKKLDKPEKVAVIYLRKNRIAEPVEVETKDGMFSIGGKSYDSRQECIWTTATKERYPLAVIREDGIVPEGTADWTDRTIQQKFSEFQDHVIKAIRHAELVREGYKDRRGLEMDAKKWIGLGIGAAIVIAVVASYI